MCYICRVTEAVFDALADPTRRRLLELLAAGERSAGELASRFSVSRPAVSRHLRVLREAGLVRARRDARRRVYALEPAPLQDVDAWIETLSCFWRDHLDRLEQHLERASTGTEDR
jgi:DNA-binding transcriptional ArsR family regulator